MLSWVLFFFSLAIVAALLGFNAVAGVAAGIAQLLFFGFLVMAVITLITGRGGRLLT